MKRMLPDDGLEDYIRDIGHLPPRTAGGQKRLTDEGRQRQIDENSQQRPRTAAGNETAAGTDEIPDDEKAAAKSRLGRA